MRLVVHVYFTSPYKNCEPHLPVGLHTVANNDITVRYRRIGIPGSFAKYPLRPHGNSMGTPGQLWHPLWNPWIPAQTLIIQGKGGTNSRGFQIKMHIFICFIFSIFFIHIFFYISRSIRIHTFFHKQLKIRISGSPPDRHVYRIGLEHSA